MSQTETQAVERYDNLPETGGIIRITVNTLQSHPTITSITVDKVPVRSGQLSSKKPLVLQPKFLESGGFFELDDENLGISVTADSLHELKEALFEEIDVLWEEYATEKDQNLTPLAQQLKVRLLNQFEIK